MPNRPPASTGRRCGPRTSPRIAGSETRSRARPTAWRRRGRAQCRGRSRTPRDGLAAAPSACSTGKRRRTAWPKTRLGGQPSTGRGRVSAEGPAAVSRHVGRRTQVDGGERHNDRQFDKPVGQHRVMPSHRRDGSARRSAARSRPPHRLPLEISAKRGAAPPVEPSAHIDVERCVDAAIAEQADKEAMAEKKLPRPAERGDREADADHRGTEHDREPHPDAFGDPPHDDAADADADPAERAGQRRQSSARRRNPPRSSSTRPPRPRARRTKAPASAAPRRLRSRTFGLDRCRLGRRSHRAE